MPGKGTFIGLIEANQGIIHKVSRIYCNDEEERKDLFQEIVMQLWKAFPSFNQQSKFSTWMYRVALNTAITQFRKISKRKEEPAEHLPVHIAEENLAEEKEERIKLLYKAINQLNPVERSIVILYLDECSYEEISGIIGISVSNVGVKINRIKKKMQKILQDLGYGL